MDPDSRSIERFLWQQILEKAREAHCSASSGQYHESSPLRWGEQACRYNTSAASASSAIAGGPPYWRHAASMGSSCASTLPVG